MITLGMMEVMHLIMEDYDEQGRGRWRCCRLLSKGGGTQQRSSPHCKWLNKLGRGQSDAVEAEWGQYWGLPNHVWEAAYEVSVNQWLFKVVPILTQAYIAMEPERAADYVEVKMAIIQHQQRDLSSMIPDDNKEGPTQNWVPGRRTWWKKWLELCAYVKGCDAEVCEQFLTSLPADTRIWVRERGPKTYAEAG